MGSKSEQYFPIVEKYLSSGLSVKSFCESNGIKSGTLEYWKKRFRDEKKRKGFASVQIIQPGMRSEITIRYQDSTTIAFSSSINPSVIKQFLPTFCK